MADLRYLSLGAGVQSSTLALMIAAGEVEAIDCAIFSDTQWESKATYAYLDWLCEPGRLPFPVHRVTAGSLRQHVIDGAKSNSRDGDLDVYRGIPAYARRGEEGMRRALALHNERAEAWEKDGRKGVEPKPPRDLGMLRRQCTREYKIAPITAKVRELLGLTHGQRVPKGTVVEQLTGISADEADRAKPAPEPWLKRLYPLLDRRITRMGCLMWMRDHKYPDPPRSSCLGCPLHTIGEWKRLRAHDPEGWRDAVEVDEAIRNGLVGGVEAASLYLHARGVPLVDAVDPPNGQADMFETEKVVTADECEGMCGN